LIFAFTLLSLIDIFFFEVIEDNSLQIEWIKECTLCEGLNVIGVDGSNLEGVFSQLDDTIIFRHL
jgi:hypothetical protein